MLSNLFQLESLITSMGPSVVYSKRNPFVCPSVHLIYLYFGLGTKWTVLRMYRVAEKSPYTDQQIIIIIIIIIIIKPFPERSHHLGHGLSRVLSLTHPHTCLQALVDRVTACVSH
jgi:hypothetical protein